MRYLINKKLLRPEELLGIEHIIKGEEHSENERLEHAKFVMNAQDELRKTSAVNMDMKLAQAVCARKSNATRKAQLLAALAVSRIHD